MKNLVIRDKEVDIVNYVIKLYHYNFYNISIKIYNVSNSKHI